MSTKEHAIETPSRALMQLTPEEAETLREGFRAELANVVSLNADSSGPSVTNINRRQRGITSKDGAAKKGTKKGASKKGTKKGASKKGAKKGARKTSTKK